MLMKDRKIDQHSHAHLKTDVGVEVGWGTAALGLSKGGHQVLLICSPSQQGLRNSECECQVKNAEVPDFQPHRIPMKALQHLELLFGVHRGPVLGPTPLGARAHEWTSIPLYTLRHP